MSAPEQQTHTTANSNSNSNADGSSAPGLVSSHVEYIKGVAEHVVGAVTGSQQWKDSAAHDKNHAVESMRTAAATRDASVQGFGRIEEAAGRVVGCEGMRKEGAESAAAKERKDL